METSRFEGATEQLLTDEPALNAFTRVFAEGVGDSLDLARFRRLFAKEAGRAAGARDHMRLLTHLLILDKEALILAWLKRTIKQGALFDAYAARVTSFVDVHPDGSLGDSASDVREMDYEAVTFVRFQAHDPRSGSVEEAVETFGKKGIIASLWSDIADDVYRRKEAAKKVAAAPRAAARPPERVLRFTSYGKVHVGSRPIVECDDRFSSDDKGAVFLVADGSGPTYGGYHVPIAMDAAISAVKRETVGAVEAGAEARLRAGMGAAAALLDEDRRAYEQRFAAALARVGGDRQRAALEASIEHARARFGRPVESFIHHAISVTAVHVHRRSLAVAQIGSCRVYRARGGAIELLAPDHLLATVSGDPMTAELHPDVCTRLLGMGSAEVDYRTYDVKGGDVLVLLGVRAWRALSPEMVEDAIEVNGGSASAIVDRLMSRIRWSVEGSAAILAVVVDESST